MGSHQQIFLVTDGPGDTEWVTKQNLMNLWKGLCKGDVTAMGPKIREREQEGNQNMLHAYLKLANKNESIKNYIEATEKNNRY